MVTEAIRHLLPGGDRREYTADERAVIEDVLDAAVEWQDGRLPLWTFWQVGTLAPRPWSTGAVRDRNDRITSPAMTCRGEDATGYSRFAALVWAVKHEDPRRRALMAAIEAAGQAGMLWPKEANR